MKKSISLLCCLWALGMTAPSVHAGDVVAEGMDVGQRYPDILLPDLDGGFGKLSDYRGRKVLLIHFASW